MRIRRRLLLAASLGALALGAAAPPVARAVPTGQSTVVVHVRPTPHPVRGSQWAPLNILYWPPFKSQSTKQVQPLLKGLLSRHKGRLRIQYMSYFRGTRYARVEKRASEAALEAYAQGGNSLFWRFHDELCALPYMHGMTAALITRAVRRAGLNVARLQSARARGLHLPRLKKERALATRLGVAAYNSSPVLLVGSTLMYASRYTRASYVDTVVRRELARIRSFSGHPRQIHQRLLAEAKRRYRPRRGTRRPGVSPTLLRRYARRYAVPVKGSPVVGSPHAWVTVVAFLDFADYNSQRAWKSLVGAIARRRGRLRLIYKSLPNRNYGRSLSAARAGHAAHAQGRFAAMAKILFRYRYRLYPNLLARYAKQAGLDATRFTRDLRDPATSRRVLQDLQHARKLNLLKAPAIFINGRRVPGRYWNATLFDQLLAREFTGGLLSKFLGPL